eukprot:6462867-Amphidinium_carterae.4
MVDSHDASSLHRFAPTLCDNRGAPRHERLAIGGWREQPADQQQRHRSPLTSHVEGDSSPVSFPVTGRLSVSHASRLSALRCVNLFVPPESVSVSAWNWVHPPTLTGRLHVEPDRFSGVPLCRQNRAKHLARFRKAILNAVGPDAPYILGRPVCVVCFGKLHDATAQPVVFVMRYNLQRRAGPCCLGPCCLESVLLQTFPNNKLR